MFAAPVPAAPAATVQTAAGPAIGKEDFFKPGLAPVRQNGPFDITIVYFMDYQCPACRKFTPDVSRAFSEDIRVRVIYRDTPIFGARSEAAARLAIASQFQGRHEAFHHALMTAKGPLDEASLRAAARKAGIDWERLQRDLDSHAEEIDRLIAWNLDLSEAAGISGTPAFVIGETLADGALDYKGLKGEIADARAAAGIATPKDAAPAEEVRSENEDAKAKEGEVAAEPATRMEEPVQIAPVAFDRSSPTPSTDPVTNPPLLQRFWPWLGLAGLGGLLVFFWISSRRSARNQSRRRASRSA